MTHEQVINANRGRLEGYVIRNGVRDHDDAEDLVSSAVLKALAGYDQSREMKFLTYLIMVVKTKVLDERRRMKEVTSRGNPRPKQVPMVEEYLAVTEAGYRDVEDSLSLAQVVKFAESRMEERAAEVFRMRLSGMNAKQIAETLGVANSVAYRHCERFEKKLGGIELW